MRYHDRRPGPARRVTRRTARGTARGAARHTLEQAVRHAAKHTVKHAARGALLLAAAAAGAGALSGGPADAGARSEPWPRSSAPGARGEPWPPSPRPVPSPAASDPFARGRQLYRATCAGCHGQDGGGSQNGPSLRDAGPADVDYQVSSGRMPLPAPDAVPRRGKPAFGRHDIDALIAYVSTLGRGEPIPRVAPGDVRLGATLYLQNCASCHSASAVGAALPDGRYAPSLMYPSPTQIAEAIRIGPGTMPRFSQRTLSDAEVNSIIGYILALRRTDDRGGAKLGGVGPVAEGLVAWVFGIGLLLIVIRLLGKRAR
ncbi:cytochrome bc1 complex diheme cytochrome c subunit [Streptosporangium sandarakinum]|uniref:cytochrome bc1 complex diheme cytochrome c subunit n=1 Tax=Streptosporangium sandarakinum TaxID=1260955 RepID=UPI0037160782